jgi:hypothetical protein
MEDVSLKTSVGVRWNAAIEPNSTPKEVVSSRLSLWRPLTSSLYTRDRQ